VLLLDIVVRVNVLNSVVQSITTNVKQLLAAMGLVLICLYLHAVWFFNRFKDEGDVDMAFGNNPGFNCTHLLPCFENFMAQGLTAGAPSFEQSVLDEYPELYLFIFSFYFFIYLIFIAVITAIIIDTFSEKRKNLDMRDEDKRNKCFICSFSRETFERSHQIFEVHIREDHNMWKYVYYVIYLRLKPELLLTGNEKRIRNMIQRRRIDWFPNQKTLVSPDEQENNTASEISEMKQQINDLVASFNTITGLLKEKNMLVQ